MDGKAVGSSSTPSNMRDWRPNDATKCGIFGIWLSDGAGTSGINTMCPGTSSTTHYCCAIDVAVAPLQYLFYQYPQTLDQLDGVCNKAFSTNAYTVDRSYPIFSKTAIQTLVAKIGRYYAIPKVNGQQTIKLYMNMLNSLLNPSGRHSCIEELCADCGLLRQAVRPAAEPHAMPRPIQLIGFWPILCKLPSGPEGFSERQRQRRSLVYR